MTFHGQEKQDYLLEEIVFKQCKDGFFVDVGANHPEHINNTLYFERTNNWKGINIEPIPTLYEKLQCIRSNCINVNCAIDSKEGDFDFVLNQGYTESISGLEEYYHPRHKERLLKENQQFNSQTKIVKICTKKLETIFDQHNVKHINYLTIDVEGAEFAVVQSINFDKVFIDVIEFDNNYENLSIPIVQYLEQKGYHRFLQTMHIFMIHQDSKFVPNVKSYMQQLNQEKQKQNNESDE